MATALPQAERLPAPFKWMGAKGRLAPWVVEHLPPGEVYVEPYAGSAALVARLLAIEGAAVLSGYDTPIYAPLLAAGWTQLRRDVVAQCAGRGRGSKVRGAGNATEHTARTECLWVSPNKQRSLF